MGRSESPLDPARPAAELAQHLRELRSRTGTTYRKLGTLSYYHGSVFCRAASGKELPSWEVVQAFVEVCHEVLDERADLAAWEALWARLRNEGG